MRTITADEFQRGMTLAQYLAQMTVNRDRLVRAMDAVTITPGDQALLEKLGRPRSVMVITEDWCGTSLAYVPFAAKLAEAAGLELRVFLRDANPDIMDRYLKRGLYRSIPVIAFFDERMTELARYIEEKPA